MNFWLINHRFSSYMEHQDLVGLPVKKDKLSGEPIKSNDGKLIPKYKITNQIQSGDKVAYYCPAPKKFIVGLFEIIEGPQLYTNDWINSIQFKIKPIYPVREENYISYYELVKSLDFFKDSEGNILEGGSVTFKLRGTIKPLSTTDFKKIENLYLKKGEESKSETVIISPTEPSLHIEMIRTSHLQASKFQCESFIGSQERNRVMNSISDKDESEKESIDIPSWISDIGDALGTKKRILYIDNIWFFEESEGFYIPFAVFEHEKDGALRTVMDHFVALDNTLKSNVHFKDIKPLYFLIAKDKDQLKSYQNKISEHGEWNKFKKSHLMHLFTIDEVDRLSAEYLTKLTDHLVNLSP